MIGLDSVEAARAMAEGLSAICATCELYWLARDRRMPGHRCLAKNGCCGPLAGGDFHEYRGPIVNFVEVCFVCGVKSVYGIRPARSVRSFGACKKHFSYFRKIRPKDGKEVPSPRAVGLNGHEVDPTLLQPYRKKTLGQAIYEVEKHYADKEGREL